MSEEREGKVYPVREDVPAELWGKPIYESPDKGKTIYKGQKLASCCLRSSNFNAS